MFSSSPPYEEARIGPPPGAPPHPGGFGVDYANYVSLRNLGANLDYPECHPHGHRHVRQRPLDHLGQPVEILYLGRAAGLHPALIRGGTGLIRAPPAVRRDNVQFVGDEVTRR